MNEKQQRLAMLLPALIFIFVPTTCILAGWYLGASNPEIWNVANMSYQSNQSAQAGGVYGSLWGLILGGFLSFGAFSMVISWAWRLRYSNFRFSHLLFLVLGWMLIPIFIFLFLLLLFL